MTDVVTRFLAEVMSSLPSGKIRAVTPDNDNDLPDGPCRGISVGTAGLVNIDDLTGTTVTVYCNLGANPYAAKRIRSTSTTAATIRAMY
jgi:hypothetical protein